MVTFLKNLEILKLLQFKVFLSYFTMIFLIISLKSLSRIKELDQ